MNEKEIVAELAKLRYPSDESGWIKRSQNGLPSYIMLRKSLFAKGIKPSLTWDKEDCLNAFKNGDQVSETIFEDKTTDALYSSVLKTFRNENRTLKNIRDITSNLMPQIDAHIKHQEETLIKKQLSMMKP
ncbi:hypothetical protein TVAG_378050 [Trichomonas vaginalis G3]|uniref:Uncharacterized protein n=1 Tax=Trichomonas vaginalis (strain ATCC PRA-98 / G3) TaxID=412133 RepID=A2DAZ6_TRIV3|nr:hypothetical protein TVAGG3_0518070 [Trichomonas vaginalis G3]EAY22326.1 hypothetical protein TVAG_378050 [Trichomonas vaginalis G3]KAI5518266.1 hypothetical protein TVAGG3_0518070 [Trichomonas vaginalis G3]|eukprot:XP_001583312.1 hypothetical protein [Trichomonas vaginalis G3]